MEPVVEGQPDKRKLPMTKHGYRLESVCHHLFGLLRSTFPACRTISFVDISDTPMHAVMAEWLRRWT